MELDTSLISDDVDGADESLIKFRQNDNLCVIAIETIDSSFGVISSCNSEVKKLLGYSQKELIGSKVNKIMPKIFNDIHDKFIQKFIEKEDSATYPSEKVVFAMHKDGIIFETALYIKIIPHESKAFQIVGFMRAVKHVDRNPSIAFISMNSQTIEGVNQSFIDLINRPIDFTNISKENLTLSSFLPNFKFKFSMKPGDTFRTELTFSNSSDKLLELEEESQEPSRIVNLRIIEVRYFDSCPMAFFELY